MTEEMTMFIEEENIFMTIRILNDGAIIEREYYTEDGKLINKDIEEY